ncbi:hypothetical protein CYMTET_35924 [Cymbomonas tetramitiformis]|uniref:EF-hand domain-containing protein n=1 Tax=Cymbomonas tetramitiformis TaxID=36881 RepID=A0AAE0F890_9CHLO|nr:hypothetical protein CYMTET_35924 [Cymbomonas tetramitiformis]
MLIALLFLTQLRFSSPLIIEPSVGDQWNHSVFATVSLKSVDTEASFTSDDSVSNLKNAFRLLDLDGDECVSFAEYAASTRRDLGNYLRKFDKATRQHAEFVSEHPDHTQSFTQAKSQVLGGSKLKARTAYSSLEQERNAEVNQSERHLEAGHSRSRRRIAQRNSANESHERSLSSVLESQNEELYLCSDSPSNWVDSDGDSCDVYDAARWCTPSGMPGEDLLAANETLKMYSVDGVDAGEVCCACGGGKNL